METPKDYYERGTQSFMRILTWLLIMLIALPMVALLSGCHMQGQASAILLWGDAPTHKEMKQLKAWGVKSIVNLRTNPLEDQQRWADELGIKVHRVKTGVMINPGEKEIERFISLVGNPENQPVYICCTGGRDRTAFYVALYRMALEGWTAEQAEGELRVHKVRRIWPKFWQYDDILRERETQIHQLASALGYPKHPDIYNGKCPCTELGVVPSAMALSKPAKGLARRAYDGHKHDQGKRNSHANSGIDIESRLPQDATLQHLAKQATILRNPKGEVAANLIYVP